MKDFLWIDIYTALHNTLLFCLHCFAEDDNDEICDITYVEMNRNR